MPHVFLALCLTVVNPEIKQMGGSWEITYKIPPEKKDIKFISAYIEGDVSNSSVPGHFRPQFAVSRCARNVKDEGPSKVFRESIIGTECVEKAKLIFDEKKSEARITLDHDHFIYGNFEPLLGKRTLTLNIDGEEKKFDLDFPLCYNRTKFTKISFKNTINRGIHEKKYDAAKDELFLSLSGTNAYFRSDEAPVKWDTVYTVKFKYMVFYGSLAQPVFFVSEYCDLATSWKVLGKTIDVELDRTPGRWHKFQKTFRAKPEASTIAYNFSLKDLNADGPSIGDMIVTDFEIVPARSLLEITDP